MTQLNHHITLPAKVISQVGITKLSDSHVIVACLLFFCVFVAASTFIIHAVYINVCPSVFL